MSHAGAPKENRPVCWGIEHDSLLPDNLPIELGYVEKP
jgi:hypothetical protein